MASDVEPSEGIAPGSVPKSFLYFFAGLVVGAVCVLLPFLCILPIVLHQARANDQLQLQLSRKDAEITQLRQRQNPPSVEPGDARFPPPVYPLPPPPAERPPERPFASSEMP